MNTEELKSKITDLNDAYRRGQPIVSDGEYDSLLELFQREHPDEYESFRNTLNEGSVEGRAKKVSHGDFIMGSLDKLPIEKPDDITAFAMEYCSDGMNISAKVDGISCRLEYRNGEFVSATTRGDGYVGMDITNKIRRLTSVPSTIRHAGHLNIRGELVIYRDDFEKMTGFSNPRNACAGIMNRLETSKDWNEDDLKRVSFVAYTILGEEYSKEEQFSILKSLGFETAWSETVRKSGKELIDHISSLDGMEFEYETDGFVISSPNYINEREYRPYGQKAVKYNNLIATTRLIDIEWNRPSKDGKISVVGIVDPVELGGATVSRVTLNNLDFIGDLGLKYGAVVNITKRGDIIPAITGVVSVDGTCREIEYPETCPCCGSTLVKDGPFLWCRNGECQDQTTYQVQHFIEKMGVENTSFKSLNKYGIHTISDLVSFKPNQKYKTEVKFYDELKNKVFTKTETDLFCAMNFRGLGDVILRKIVGAYGLDRIRDAVKSDGFTGPEFTNLPSGVGNLMMERFKVGVADALSKVDLICCDQRYKPVETNTMPNSPKTGISVCFTGSLNTMSRQQAQRRAENNGWEAKTTVTKGLTYLVTNEKTMTTKMKKALEYGTRIITEDEFIGLVSPSNCMNDL